MQMDSIRRLEPAIASILQRWIDQGKTYREIVNMLDVAFPNVARGFSVRSLRRFCRNYSVGKRRGADLDYIVAECVTVVSNRMYVLMQ